MEQLDDKWKKGNCLLFRDDGVVSKGSKTHKFSVFDRKSGVLIGYVKWFAQWRQYVFYPLNVPLLVEMLNDAQTFLTVMTKEQRDKRKS